MVDILFQVNKTSAAEETTGLTEIYFTHPGWASQGTMLSSLKKLMGVVEVVGLY